jgi:two-component system sensor histidine kinase PilS (NtrC family)
MATSGRAELHIIDDGAGIDEEAQGKIFEPFFTTHGKGTGLGLYIARELCEANDALLEWVDNQPGAHFRIIGRNQRWQENQNAEDSLD